MTYIFEKIINTGEIFIIIESHFDDPDEQEHIKTLVRDTIHHKLVDMVLDELEEENKALFLKDIDNEEKHQSLLDQLKSWIENFEEKLHLKAKEAESEIMTLINVD